MNIALDHVGIVGRDMAPLLTWARKQGFAPTEPKPLYGSPHEGGTRPALGQDSAHIVLERGYIELSAVSDLSKNAHLTPYLKHREGLLILAFECDDLEEMRRRCALYLPTEVQHASREIQYGDRHGWAKFDWFMLSPNKSPDGLVCFVYPHDKALIYQSAVTSHPNGASALTGISIAADAGTRERYAHVLGDPGSCGVHFADPGDQAPQLASFAVASSKGDISFAPPWRGMRDSVS